MKKKIMQTNTLISFSCNSWFDRGTDNKWMSFILRAIKVKQARPAARLIKGFE